LRHPVYIYIYISIPQELNQGAIYSILPLPLHHVQHIKLKTLWVYFIFCWPCISIHPCSENQLDALLVFILSLFRQSTSTCFEHICSPSSGLTLYIYNNWYVLCFLVDPANRQFTKKQNTYHLYIYSIPPDDGLQIFVCPKNLEFDWRNKLRINSASSWFSLHRCCE